MYINDVPIIWQTTDEPGNQKRPFEYFEDNNIELFKSPNNIVVIRCKDTAPDECTVVFSNDILNKRLKKNTQFVTINGITLKFSFPIRIMETRCTYNEKDDNICIFLIDTNKRNRPFIKKEKLKN